jgi:hypothetical protein
MRCSNGTKVALFCGVTFTICGGVLSGGPPEGGRWLAQPLKKNSKPQKSSRNFPIRPSPGMFIVINRGAKPEQNSETAG